MKIVAFLPAKGSSSRVENKNVKLLDGKPLFLHTLEKLLACDFIDEVYLDTESDYIIDLASYTNAKIMKRDISLADNKTDGNKLFLNEVKHVDADIYIQVLCTSPFINPQKILDGINAIKDTNEFDSAVLIKKEKQYTWSDNKTPDYDIKSIPNSVDIKDTIIETMGLYIVKKETALQTKRRIGNKPYLIEASVEDSFDVNYEDDFNVANLIAAGKRERDRKLLNNMKSFMSSPLLSDILDDFGYRNQIIKGLSPNIQSAKLLGRAKTLRLRELKEDEPYDGIYKALSSYETIIPNDIIMVENEMDDFAYFGELNANLAIRSGAAGVIVGGHTRDGKAVYDLALPVFSKGYTCQDVRQRATLDFINNPINMYGVTVHVGDLVFADSEGVVVIPNEIESAIIDTIYQRGKNEKNILLDISQGVDTDILVKRYGFF
ncbi:cytidylyltransferase domain-containing protein [Lelliottia sp. RWM.1]|uniref:RraA family protein n=1 Tax=Lelliottia sp. RWM.1 TaxID=2663242 RepID=UPI00193D3AFC|nr:cytidyltransferase [Lelliottia sp. RWM.1]MBM3074594.1 cytidyltransferase [Lelliottia sp. RWM.1]